MLRQLVRFQNWQASDEGASLVEYAFLLLLIAVVVMAVLTQVGTTSSSVFSRTNEGFN
ncbi:MAG: Flp family type IVb pilin [bacterium]|nr:Flp family type IVb pilin [bacterium]